MRTPLTFLRFLSKTAGRTRCDDRGIAPCEIAMAVTGRVCRRVVLTSALPCLILATSCGTETTPQADPAPEFRAALPSSAPLTIDDIQALKDELAKPDGHPPAQKLSAAAFDDYSARAHVQDPEWVTFISTYAAVRETAIANGWSILVEGFTQATDPVGTLDPLSVRRANTARLALIDVDYPPARVEAVGRGVGGPDPDDRRVLITFVRTDR